ncbi:MAG: hypothetical protein HOK71_15925, partial [Planctomycetaceae bacterium]|nr:hypothetical protein [Planctomycetaceae bacterium]
PPQFHQDIVVDGHRFTLNFGHIFKGYKQRRKHVPQAWIDQVEVVVEQSTWTTSSSKSKTKSSYGWKNSWDDDGDDEGNNNGWK